MSTCVFIILFTSGGIFTGFLYSDVNVVDVEEGEVIAGYEVSLEAHHHHHSHCDQLYQLHVELVDSLHSALVQADFKELKTSSDFTLSVEL